MQGIPMVASSPVRHDSPLNLHGLEVTSYQPPWKALSDFALITKSFLLNELPHLSHFVPNNLENKIFISYQKENYSKFKCISHLT